MILFLSLQREVLLVQLDGLHCRLYTGERQNYNLSDPRGCGMPLKTCGENRFLWPRSSDLYFTVWGELTCRATSGAGCVCTNFPPPPPAPSWLPQLERWELNSPVVKQQQTSLPDGMVEWGKDCVGGGSGPAGETNPKRTECVFCLNARPNRSKGLFSRKTWQSVNSAHTVTQNTALCKSSENAFTFHSCSYFKQA